MQTVDEKKLAKFNKIELIRMLLQIEEDYEQQKILLESLKEDFEAMQELLVSYINERAKMRKEIAKLKETKSGE